MIKFNPPAGFERINIKHGFVLVKGRYRDILKEAILDWLDNPRTALEIRHLPGRGKSISFKVAHPELKRIFIKSYRRGGLRGLFLRNLYWGPSRFLEELRISEYALGKDLPVAEALGLVIRQPLPGFYQAHLITREIPAAQDLARFLRHRDAYSILLLPELAKKVAAALVRFHNEGVYHPDLNLRNILVDTDGFTVYLVDLDRARVFETLSFEQRMRNLMRLARSVIKIGLERVVAKDIRLQFLRTYLSLVGKDTLETKETVIRKCHRNIKWHRLWWRIFP